jgi:hypothetical protein
MPVSGSAVSKALRAKAGERKRRDAAADGTGHASSTTAAGEDGPSKDASAGVSKGGERQAKQGDADAEMGGVGPSDDADLGVQEESAGAAQSMKTEAGKEEAGEDGGSASDAHNEDPEDGDEKIGVSIEYFCCKKCKERAIETVRSLSFSLLDHACTHTRAAHPPIDLCACSRVPRQVLVPCGHKAFCKRCGKGLKECPLCKVKVHRVQTIFHV